MVKLIQKMFQSRSAFEIEARRAEKEVSRDKDAAIAPRFHPTNGGYQYQRYIDIETAVNSGTFKRRTYKAYFRLAFSPAPDFGWVVSGVGNEWFNDRAEDLVKLIISNGRVVANGRFFWIEERRGGKEKHLVTGTVEPAYKVFNSNMVVDKDVSFQAKYITDSDAGNTTWKSIKKFYMRENTDRHDASIEKPPSAREKQLADQLKRYQELQQKYALKQSLGDSPDELTEECTEEEDYRIAVRSIAEMAAIPSDFL